MKRLRGRFEFGTRKGGMKYEPVFFMEDACIRRESLAVNLELIRDFTYAKQSSWRSQLRGFEGPFREQPRFSVRCPRAVTGAAVLG